MAPTNFALTNSAVLRETVESGGGDLLRGLRNLLRDLDGETGGLRIRMADPEAFRPGRDVACTPGKEAAGRREGSWWPAWRAELSGGQVPAREPEGGALEPLGDAPGEYVLGKA